MKILIFNGGGVFGLLPAFALANTVSTSISKDWDAFGGTSIGAALAISYNQGLLPEDVVGRLLETLPKIFKKTWRYHTPLCPNYSDKVFIDVLQKHFPSNFNDNPNPLFINAYNLKTSSFKVFDNVHKFYGDAEFKDWEIIKASASAPTYFKPYKGYIDGGIIANNPVMTTVCGISDKLNIPFKDMEVCVLGTSSTNNYKNINTNKYLEWQWLSPMLNILVTGNSQLASFQAKQMPFKKYTYISPDFVDYDANLEDLSTVYKWLDPQDDYHNDVMQAYLTSFQDNYNRFFK